MTKANNNVGHWKYLVVLSKFTMLFIDSGIEKSFGVLIPTMVERLESDYATIGLICSMPPTIMYILCPFVTLALRLANHRSVAMSGGLLSGVCIIACAFMRNTVAVGVFLALAGAGFSMTFTPLNLALNDSFQENFVFWSTLTSYGYTSGSMLMPIVIEKSLQAYGYEGAFLILGAITLHTLVCGAAIRKTVGNGDASRTGGSNNHGNAENKHKRGNQNGELMNETDMHLHWEEEGEEEESQEKEREDGNCKETCQEKRRLIQREPVLARNAPAVLCHGLLQERIFLVSIPIAFLVNYIIYAWMLFLVPHAEELGIPPPRAIYLSTIGGIAGVIGRSVLVILLKYGANDLVVYIIVGTICTFSFLLDFIGSAYPLRAVLAFTQGLCFFIEDNVYISLSKKAVFDEANFDIALSLYSFTCGVGISCGGLLTGYLFDVTRSFTKVFIIIGFIHAIAVINLLLVVVLIRRRGEETINKCA
ncbi:monocarboxylate transporter 14-like [Lytechinus variegatus]|uniref:monocarboxylate transporter 14-like n=1 Tax=Lytechinus variegatus TaxID=7654 RepID=UPI001BB23BCD|nr:monocarboxylate transporter 14-like [Lytechinus variegatus]